jgi:hypothetical protein
MNGGFVRNAVIGTERSEGPWHPKLASGPQRPFASAAAKVWFERIVPIDTFCWKVGF